VNNLDEYYKTYSKWDKRSDSASIDVVIITWEENFKWALTDSHEERSLLKIIGAMYYKIRRDHCE